MCVRQTTPARPLTVSALYTVMIFTAWGAYVGTAYVPIRRAAADLAPFANEAVRACVFALPALLLLRAEGVRRPWDSLKLSTHAGRGVVWGALVGCALVATHAGLTWGLSGQGPRPIPAEAYFTALGVATVIEEVAFRGFLLQHLAVAVGFWSANLASALLFAAIHIPGWLLVDRAVIGADKVVPLMEIFTLGLGLGYLLRRTGSLWSCVLAHSANNLAAVAFYGAGAA